MALTLISHVTDVQDKVSINLARCLGNEGRMFGSKETLGTKGRQWMECLILTLVHIQAVIEWCMASTGDIYLD